jgi:hypothetical protein
MEKKLSRNDHPLWVDIAKQFLDEHGRETILKVLELILPQGVKDWVRRDKIRRAALGSALSAASIGASRLIPDSPLGVVIEEAVREVVATVKDFMKGESSPETAEEIAVGLPRETEEKISAVSAAVRLGMGDLPMEEQKNLAYFLTSLQSDLGTEASNKALIMLGTMPYKDISRFAKLPLQDQVAEFKARTWKPDAEKKKDPPKGPGVFARKRIEFAEAHAELKESVEAARSERRSGARNLSAAWNNLLGKETDDPEDDGDDPQNLTIGRVVVPVRDL